MEKLGFDTKEITIMIEELNILLANLQVHAQKLRNFHWNVTGADFFEIHDLTEEEYIFVNKEIDGIAERVRILGGKPCSTFKKYLELSEIEEQEKQLSSKEMIACLLEDIEVLITAMMDVIDRAGELGDVGTYELIVSSVKHREELNWKWGAFIQD